MPIRHARRHSLRTDPGATARGHLVSAGAVVLATLGCTVPGPTTPAATVEPMRHTLAVGAPLDVSLSVLRAGDPAGTRLILVHGTPGDAGGWADYLADPPSGLEVWALDRPGFGESGPNGALTSLTAQAAAVEAMLPRDGRQAILLGHSLGAPIVARVAADRPAVVAAVILLAGSLDPALETIHPMQWVGAWAPVRALLPRAIRNANAELMALKPELEALAPSLARIVAPVVIVHGTHDDLVPVANVAYVQRHLPAARCVTAVLLEGRNHFLPWNAADAVREAIRTAQRAVAGRRLAPDASHAPASAATQPAAASVEPAGRASPTAPTPMPSSC